MKITAKHRLFVARYLINLNPTQAGLEAGFAKRTGTALMHKPEIQALIAEMGNDRLDRAEVDNEWVLRRLVDEAEADLNDLYEPGTGRLKPVEEWPLIWRKGLVAGVKAVETDDGTVIKEVKLSDRVKRLELLGKHVKVGAFSEKHEHTGKDGGPIQTEMDLSKLNDDQLKQLAVIVAAAGGNSKGD